MMKDIADDITNELCRIFFYPILLTTGAYYIIEESTRTHRWKIYKIVNKPIVYTKYVVLGKEGGSEDPKFHGYLNDKHKQQYYKMRT